MNTIITKINIAAAAIAIVFRIELCEGEVKGVTVGKNVGEEVLIGLISEKTEIVWLTVISLNV